MKEAIITYNEKPEEDGTHMAISWTELVRCKDCKHGYLCENDVRCENKNNPAMVGQHNSFDWFCADGEMKE